MKDKNRKLKANYDIEILYTYPSRDIIIPRKYFNDRYLNDGKLYLFFESHFNNDTITVRANNEIFTEKIIKTDQSTGLAYVVKIDNINEIRNIAISVNHGKEAIFEVDASNQVEIDFRNKKLSVRFLANVPYYD